MTPMVPLGEDNFKGIVLFGELTPMEYTGWQDEVLAWTEGSYLGTSISNGFNYRVSGPDAVAFFKRYCVNNIDTWKVGKARHIIMVNDRGEVMTDGVVMRYAEDDFYTVWLLPYIQFCVDTCGMDIKGENLTGAKFMFQIAGPTSLTIIERAAQEDMHDIEFLHFRKAVIAGHEVDVLRLGMAGSLAYEIHGDTAASHDVYNAIWSAGSGELGLKKLGYQAYMLNHTEDGFPQGLYHFDYPYMNVPGMVEWASGTEEWQWLQYPSNHVGSAAGNRDLYARNPIELNWGHVCNLNHDFVGRDAIAELKANPKRRTVTLEWNADDIADVWASQFRDGEPYAPIDRPNDYLNFDPSMGQTIHVDLVKVGDKVVGLSSGRARSVRYQRMISQCVIDLEYAEEGTEVKVVWGDPGTRQKEIRATVARFPYLVAERNEDVDVSKVPVGC